MVPTYTGGDIYINGENKQRVLNSLTGGGGAFPGGVGGGHGADP